jgi:hypothetical protein
LRQQFLKAPSGSTGAWIVVAESLDELELAAFEAALAALDAGL